MYCTKNQLIMTEILRQKLVTQSSRWTVLGVVALTMFYVKLFITDVMAPLKPMLESQLGWDSSDYGFFTSAYGWFNVFLLMLIFGGIILDKMGVHFTGLGACILMVVGCALKYYTGSMDKFRGSIFGVSTQVMVNIWFCNIWHRVEIASK